MYSGSGGEVRSRATASRTMSWIAAVSILWVRYSVFLEPSPIQSLSSLLNVSTFWVIAFRPNRTDADLSSPSSATACSTGTASSTLCTKSSISPRVISHLPRR